MRQEKEKEEDKEAQAEEETQEDEAQEQVTAFLPAKSCLFLLFHLCLSDGINI